MSLRKASLNQSIKALVKKVNRKEFVFDNVVQRKLCWDVEKKSLLIHSILMGYPIPPLYCKKGVDSEGKAYYDALDGKQRANAVADFLNGDFALSEIPEVLMENEDTGELEPIDISNCYFKELPVTLQQEIETTVLTIYYFEDITDDEVAELFYRLNNGKPLTTFELTRAKAFSREKIIELGQHDIFKASMSTKQIGGYANEDTVVKSLIVLNEEKKSLDGKDVRNVTKTLDITEEMATDLTDIYNRIISVHDIICPTDEEGAVLDTVSKNDKKIAKRIYTRTHMISIVPMVKQSIIDKISVEDVASWLKGFFDGGSKTSIDENYNSVVKQGANKESSVKTRLDALKNSYNKTFKADKTEEQEVEPFAEEIEE